MPHQVQYKFLQGPAERPGRRMRQILVRYLALCKNDQCAIGTAVQKLERRT